MLVELRPRDYFRTPPEDRWVANSEFSLGQQYTCRTGEGLLPCSDGLSRNADESSVTSESSESDYDAFRHLRHALFWSDGQLMFALTFYADDAGKRDDSNWVVAGGWIGTIAQWDRFCSDWRLQLASVGLPYFHATDFFTGYGEVFAGWNSDKRKKDREELLRKLSRIIGAYSLHSFTVSVHTELA